MDIHINYLQAKARVYLENTGVYLRFKAGKYIQPGLKAGKGPSGESPGTAASLLHRLSFCLSCLLNGPCGYVLVSAPVSPSLYIDLFLFLNH